MEKRAREGGRAGPRYIFRKKEGKVTAMLKKCQISLQKSVCIIFLNCQSFALPTKLIFFAFFDVLVPLPLGARYIFGPLLVLLLVVQTAAVKKKSKKGTFYLLPPFPLLTFGSGHNGVPIRPRPTFYPFGRMGGGRDEKEKGRPPQNFGFAKREEWVNQCEKNGFCGNSSNL